MCDSRRESLRSSRFAARLSPPHLSLVPIPRLTAHSLGTVLGIAGRDFVVLGADTRQSDVRSPPSSLRALHQARGPERPPAQVPHSVRRVDMASTRASRPSL